MSKKEIIYYTSKKPATKHLSAKVEGDELVIRIGVRLLAHCVQNCGDLEGSVRIDDAQAFAKRMAQYLLYDDETGATELHRTFDKAAWDIFESGEPELEDLT